MFLLVGCGGGSGEAQPSYQGDYIDAAEYTLGYTESVLQIAQEAADIIELIGLYPGNIIESGCYNNGNIRINLDDLDKNGIVSKDDEIRVEYNRCFRGAVKESVSGNILISMNEEVDSQQFGFEVSFESLNFIVPSLDSLTLTGAVSTTYINDGNVHSLDISSKSDSFGIKIEDEDFKITETLENYRVNKTINLQSGYVEVTSHGEIRSPIFSSPLKFSTINSLSGKVGIYPSDLLIEFSSGSDFKGTVSADSSSVFFKELNATGQVVRQDSFGWLSIIEGFLWDNPLSDANYPSSYLNRDDLGGEWQEKELVENEEAHHASFPRISVSKNNNIFAVWQQYDGARWNIFANKYDYGEGWETPDLLETRNEGNSIHHQIAADNYGNAIAVWSQDDGQRFNIWWNRYIDGAGWQVAELLETDDSSDAKEPQIGMDAEGNAIVVWEQYGDSKYKIYGKRYLKDSGWEVEKIIATETGKYGGTPVISVNDSGSALVVWRLGYKTNNLPLLNSLMGASYSSEAGWSNVGLVETNEAGSTSDYSVILDNQGNGFAVWSQDDGSVHNIMYNRFLNSSGWQGAELLEHDDYGSAGNPYITLDHNMVPVVIWSQVMNTYGYGFRPVLMSRFDQNDGWSLYERISDKYGTVFYPKIMFDSRGNAIAQWFKSESGSRNLEYRRFSDGNWSNIQVLAEGVLGGNRDLPAFTVFSSGEAVSLWGEANGAARNIYSSIFN